MKAFLPFLLLLFVFQLFGCSEDAVNHSEKELKEAEATEQKAQTVEDHSELYYMYGTQITHRLCYASSCESDILESDTLKTSFLVRLKFNSDKPDSVLFNGLEGANSTPRQMFNGFNGGSAAYPDYLCGSSSECGHARKSGNDLKFEFSSPGGHYTGTGTLDNNRLTIQAQYRYRGAGADYSLEGQRYVE